MKSDTSQLKAKAQVHNFAQNSFSNEHDFHQNDQIELLKYSKSQNVESHRIANDTFHSHVKLEIVMANDEAFGAFDFQHNPVARLQEFVICLTPNDKFLTLKK